MRGRTTPRLRTEPLVTGPPGPCGCGCALSPETSVGFDQAEFAEVVLACPFMPWQRWLVIHAGEMLPDGRPRFRTVHVQVARQSGKTHIPVVLSLFWQVVDQVPLILGTSTKIDYAKESWMKAIRVAEKAPGLRGIIPTDRRKWTRQANGEQESWIGESRHKIAAANEEGGRSLTVHRLVLDELRQHHSYAAWDASVPATSAVPDAQIWTLSNAGTDRSVVLNDERRAALRFIETGEGDPRTGWFEWSCLPSDEPLDLEALAQANPALGITITADALLSEARKAVEVGGAKLSGFRTESMCVPTANLDPAIDAAAWARCGPLPDRPAASLAPLRARLALGVDVSPDGLHAVAYAAAVAPDGAVHVDPVKAWSGPDATRQLRAELPALVARVRPKVIGWFPSGPAAAVAADLADRKVRSPWPPNGVRVEAIRAEVPAVCMGFEELVRADQLRHPADPLLDAQVTGAERLKRGETWVFGRSGAGYVTAVYSAAAAAHLARTMPVPLTVQKVITVPR